jgi:hypothetical protein
MRNKILLIVLAACVPAVLSAGAITATTITVNVTTGISTADDYLLYLGCAVPLGACNPTTGVPGIGLIGAVVPAGVQPPVTKTIPGTVLSGILTAVGLASPTDVVIALGSGEIITGATWASFFSTPESQIAGDLLSGSPASQTDLETFFEANLADFVPLNGVSGSVGEFSTGVVVGSFSASTAAVPEPGTLGLTGLLLGGLAFLNRRRFSRAS